jgi:plastocyanin
MVNQLTKKLLLGTVMGSVGLFLVACGQNGADPNSDSGTQSNTAAAASQQPSPESSKMEMPAKPSPTAGKAQPTSSNSNEVTVENFSFQPAAITVKAGTTVTWVNHDDIPHTVYDINKQFKSETLDTDGKFSYKFTTAGTYSYFCSLHPRMTGQVIVK